MTAVGGALLHNLQEAVLEVIGVHENQAVSELQDQLRPLFGRLGLAPVRRHKLVHIGRNHRLHSVGHLLAKGHRHTDRCQLLGLLGAGQLQVALDDRLVLGLQVGHALEERILAAVVVLGQEQLALQHELEFAALAGLLHNGVTHVVFVAQRARGALQVRIGRLGIRICAGLGVLLLPQIVDKHTQGVDAGVLEVQPARAHLQHLGDVEIRCEGQVLGDDVAVDQVNGREDGGSLLVSQDLLHRGHETRAVTTIENGLEGAQAVPSVVDHRTTSAVSLLDDVVQQEVLELGRRREGADAHAHHLPALGHTLGARVVAELLDNQHVDLVADGLVLKTLAQDVLGEHRGERQLLVAHVTQQVLVNLQCQLVVLSVEVGDGLGDNHRLEGQEVLLDLGLVEHGTTSEIIRRAQVRVVLHIEACLLGDLLAHLAGLLGSIVRLAGIL
mmetsp:Transcript_55283/g.96875  ORF Transcript_55283/g.96875 Transcript_55283/m.96875 type:complete len:443 (-) Transcript_55283:383-1711(-)